MASSLLFAIYSDISTNSCSGVCAPQVAPAQPPKLEEPVIESKPEDADQEVQHCCCMHRSRLVFSIVKTLCALCSGPLLSSPSCTYVLARHPDCTRCVRGMSEGGISMLPTLKSKQYMRHQ